MNPLILGLQNRDQQQAYSYAASPTTLAEGDPANQQTAKDGRMPGPGTNLSGSDSVTGHFGGLVHTSSSQNAQTVMSAENLINVDGASRGGAAANQLAAGGNTSLGSKSHSAAQSLAASIHSSPYSVAYHHQIVNNQMAQLHQLQQEHIREKEQLKNHLPPSDGDEGSLANDNTVLESMANEDPADMENFIGGPPGASGSNPNGGIPGN